MLRRLRIENLVLIRDAALELAPGLNAVTGETGAGKTIFAQAIGLLLGAKGETSAVGPAATEAYVEAELDVPEGFFDDGELSALSELRPVDEPGLVLARRVFADGRTRAYAWGRAVAREDLAAATERLVAMSGQFEQRRLGRPSYQLEVVDRFVGEPQLRLRRETASAWRELSAARKRLDELERDAEAGRSLLSELRALVDDTQGLEAGEEDALRTERERLRSVAELGEGAAAAVAALEPEEGDGAAALAAAAERALAALEGLAPELGPATEELRDIVVRLQDVASETRRFLTSLEADPARTEHVEERLDLIASARRRFRADSFADLIERRDAARTELEALGADGDPIEHARRMVAVAEEHWTALARELSKARTGALEQFSAAVAAELADVGMGEGEFRAGLRERDAGPTGYDEVSFIVRPNPGMAFGPVAETSSGGELSRVALAIAAVSGGETIVFDEIDAGIGGVTAHRVAEVLRRLAERAQVITITHLPQIASVADAQFRVEKIPGDPTHTRIERLDELQRRDELERMLGGEEFVAALSARPER